MNFNCKKCGKCCNKKGYVYFELNEVVDISKYLNLPINKFIKKYLKKDENNRYYLKNCPFYENGCIIYDVRPVQCRQYPFWYNIVKTKKNWNNEAKKCNGIKIID
jgi:hypothetical protein